MRFKVLATGTLVLALVIGASYVPEAEGWPVLAVVLLLLGAFAAGWPRLLKVPAPNPVSIVTFVTSAAAALLAYFGQPVPGLRWLVPCLGMGLILMFLTQLFRGADAKQRLESVAVGAAGLVVAGLGSGWVALGTEPEWRVLMLVSGLSMLGAAVPAVTRLPDRIVFPLGFVLAALLGGAASMLDADVNVVPAMLLGATCGLVVVGARAMLISTGGPRTTVQILAAALAPLLVCGSVVWCAQLLMG